MIFFATCTLIFCGCHAQRTNVGPLNIKVNKLFRKTDSLQREVDDIWGKILASDVHVQEYGNKTRADNVTVDDYDKECVAKVDDAVSNVKELKSEVKHFVVTSRAGFKNEKKWQRETVSNLTNICKNCQADVTAEIKNVKHHLEKVDTELERIDESCNMKLETINTELKERKHEAVKEREHMRTVLDDLRTNQNKLDDLRTNQNRLESENQALSQTILEIQNDYENMKTENQDLSQNILEMQTKLTKLQAICTTTPSSTPTTITTPTTTTSTPFLHSCDEGWRSFNGHCYLFVEEEKAWDDASSHCKKINSYLIEITSDTELEFAAELIRDSRYYAFWIGATDRAKEGRFVYQHSVQLVPEKYWPAAQPNNNRRDKHCAYMYLSYGNLELWDLNCIRDLHFVCEKP